MPDKQLRVTTSNNGTQLNEPHHEEVDEEQLRTLFCGSLNEKVDEEILYELFQNAGPLENVKIPKDRETKKQKNFGFIKYQHEDSVKYAFDLLNNVELFGQKLRLQNKETGLGMRTGFRKHARSNTMPNLHMANGRRNDKRDQERENSRGAVRQDETTRMGSREFRGMMRQNSFGGSHPMPNGYASPQMEQNGGNKRQDRREQDYARESHRDRSYERRGHNNDGRDDQRRKF